MKLLIPFGSFLLVALTACMGPGHVTESDLSESERKVKAFDNFDRARASCPKLQELGIIEATSGTSFKMGSYEAGINALKQKAQKAGGDAFYVLDHGKTGMADSVTAKAIKCHGN